MEQSIELLEKCPACQSADLKLGLQCIDHTFSKTGFQIQQCKACGLLFTNPRPTESAIGKYYQNPEYVSHTDTKTGLLFRLYAFVKRYSITQKRLYVSKLSKDQTLLDYGAGTGDFAIALLKHKWNVLAFEPDTSARSRIQQKEGQMNLVSDLKEVRDLSMSVITLWHVLEHVHRLEETLQHFSRIISANGHLVIAVPNHNSYDASFYKSEWAAYDVPRHLYHFDAESLPPILARFGFQLISTKPMWFDSFYVSLLSEKNSTQNGFLSDSLGWSRAFLIGAISNFYALIDKKKCSSLIYTFQKRN